MTTYNDPTIIYNSSRLTYNGERASDIGSGAPPEFVVPADATPSTSVGSPTPEASSPTTQPQIPEIR